MLDSAFTPKVRSKFYKHDRYEGPHSCTSLRCSWHWKKLWDDLAPCQCLSNGYHKNSSLRFLCDVTSMCREGQLLVLHFALNSNKIIMWSSDMGACLSIGSFKAGLGGPWRILGGSWRDFAGILGESWRMLGDSWGILGGSWGVLWGSGGDLGVILGDLERFGKVLEGTCMDFGGFWGYLGRILGQFAWILRYLGVILGILDRSWGILGVSWRYLWYDLVDILRHFGGILAAPSRILPLPIPFPSSVPLIGIFCFTHRCWPVLLPAGSIRSSSPSVCTKTASNQWRFRFQAHLFDHTDPLPDFQDHADAHVDAKLAEIAFHRATFES